MAEVKSDKSSYQKEMKLQERTMTRSLKRNDDEAKSTESFFQIVAQ